MSNQLKQRLVEITTKEVSVVDDPANEQHWLVVKNKQGAPMSTANANTAPTPDSVIASAMEAADAIETASKSKDPVAVAKAMEDALAVAKSIKAVTKGMAPPFKSKEEMMADEEKKKSMGPPMAFTVGVDGSLTLSHDVAKALGGVTDPGSIENMVAASKSMMAVVAKANPTAFATAMADLQKMQLPATIVVTSMVRPQAEGEMPTMVTKSLKEKDDEIASLSKRLAKLEGESRPSNATTDSTTPVTKNADGGKGKFWGGIIS